MLVGGWRGACAQSIDIHILPPDALLAWVDVLRMHKQQQWQIYSQTHRCCTRWHHPPDRYNVRSWLLLATHLLQMLSIARQARCGSEHKSNETMDKWVDWMLSVQVRSSTRMQIKSLSDFTRQTNRPPACNKIYQIYTLYTTDLSVSIECSQLTQTQFQIIHWLNSEVGVKSQHVADYIG